MKPRAILVDDEPVLLDYLGTQLGKLWPELDIVGTARNGQQGLQLARECKPDIAFLDIHMPGMSGLQLAAELDPAIRVVFVTAFDQHAVDAFEHAAADYVLKPVSAERLGKTVQRLRQSAPGDSRREVLNLLRELQPAQRDYLQWIRAGQGDRTELIAADEVVYFRAEQKYTSVFTQDREHLVRCGISELEDQLDPAKFWRIHRGLIVQVGQIKDARRDLRGRYTIALKDRPEHLRSSASYGHLFRKM